MTDDIDDMVRAAASAHHGLVGADYFDALPARVLERLDRDERLASVVPNEVAMMSDTTSKDSPRGDLPLAPGGGPAPERSDDSGLHDMKALAQTAKQRISRRITSQHDAYDESLLSSSQSGLRAVALPAPAQLVSLPSLPGQPGLADGGAAVTPISAASDIRTAKKSRTAMWVIGGGLVAAAAAAAFIVGSGRKGEQADPSAAQVARVDNAAAPADGTAAATGTPGAVAAPTGGAMPPPAPQVTALDPALAPGAAPAESEVAADDASKEKSERAAGSGSAARDQKSRTGEGKVGAGGGGAAAADKASGGGSKKGDKTTADKAVTGDKTGGATAGGDKSIEDLLSEASGGAQKPTDSGGGEAKPDKTGLDGKDIRSGMSAVAGKAQGCFDQHGVAGHVKVKAVVDPSGKVTKADATGEFAGTPTGSCVAGVVKGASFATWTGAPMTISYGFTLQE